MNGTTRQLLFLGPIALLLFAFLYKGNKIAELICAASFFVFLAIVLAINKWFAERKNKQTPSVRPKVGLRKRNEMDKWPLIVEKGMENPDKENTVTYTLTETSLGNPISIQATTTQHCVYCESFSDSEFRDPAFPEGGGYCKSWNGAVGFKDSCKDWRPNVRVKYWFSKGYMEAKGRTVKYQLIDDGPDGGKGAS